MKRYDNQTVFITGASSGIGEACAKQFAQLGAKLILTARRKQRLDELSKSLSKTYQTEVLPIALDVTDNQQVQQEIDSLPNEWRNIDLLINNAGLAAGKDKFQEATLDDWTAMIDTNVKGLLYVTKAIIPLMLQKNSGHIVNIGSTAGHQAYSGGTVYCATKAAVRKISAGLRLDLHGSAIRVSEIDPGLTETEFSVIRFKGDHDKAAATYQGMTPLSADDIADAVVYCATRPAHVNICELVLMPTDQSGIQLVYRKEKSPQN